MSQTRTEWILELVDRVTKPLRTIENASKSSGRSIAVVERVLSKTQGKIHTVTGRLRKMALAGAAFGFLAMGSVQFSHGMARANTMAGLGIEQFSALKNEVRGIAEIVPIAREQLSGGLYNTISAGVPKDNWISFLNDSSRSAIAGNAELGTVVDTTASFIKAYGASFEKANEIQDQFQKTVKLGQIPSLQALGSALPRVTAVSAALKVSQEELLSVFATASGVMGAPAEVATQLNAVLSALSKPSSEATKMAEKLGIAFNATSIDKAGGLQNYITQLMPKIQQFSDKTGVTQAQIIGNLFGSAEAVKLIVGLSGELSSSWAQNTLDIKTSSGEVQRAFDIMSATTQSKSIVMKNAFGNMMDGVVDVLAPFAIIALRVTAQLLGMITGFMRANPVISKFIILGVALVGGIVFIVTAFTLMALKLDAIYLKLLRASLSANGFTGAMSRAALSAWNFVRSSFAVIASLARQLVSYAITGASMLASYVGSVVTATAAQWGLNIAMDANPIGLVILAIAGLIMYTTLIVKKYEDWGAALAFVSGGIGLIINIIQSFRRHWDSIVEAFQGEGIIGGLKRIGAVFLDAFLMPAQQLLEILSKIPGLGDLASGGVAAIDNLRERLNLSVAVEKTDEDSKTEVRKSGSTSEEDIDPTNDLTSFGTPNTNSLGGGSNGVTGNSNNGKSISMTLNIEQHFSIGGNVKESVKEIANEVVAVINDRLRDSIIALD